MPKKNTKKRLVLLDSHAIIHRAYHALPDFSAPDGQPTGALYGLSAMLLRIIQDLKPDYIVACYDLPKPTLRHEAYEAYKGTRGTIEDALIAQLTSSRRVFEAFGIPVYEKEGFEADDILGTIVELHKKDKDLEIVIASGDMDTLQLVEKKKVQVYTLKKGLNDIILYDEKAVEERFGFGPKLIPDYKGLRGDPSDNIIGIPGVGEKTATDLITKFGTIESIYKKLKKDEQQFLDGGIKARIIGLLKEHEEDALFSKMLATIRTDAPVPYKLPEELKLNGNVLPNVLTLFDELGFRTLKARVRTVLGGGVEPTKEEATEEETEDVESLDQTKFQEAQLMLWLLASDYTNPSLDDILAYTKKEKFDEAYVALVRTLSEEEGLLKVYDTIEKPLIPVLREAEAWGVLVDTEEMKRLSVKYKKELGEIERRIYKAAGHEFNISSPKQLGDVLFDELGLVVKGQKKTTGGQRSTRESELEKIRDLHPVIEDILEYRQVQKLLSTYVDSIPPLLDAGGRLHANFLQAGTTTGRMASQNPNLQNIPVRSDRGRAIRNAFIAPKGFELVALDYSQIELRIAAILSEDEKLMNIFKSGRDVHTEVASAVFGVEADKVDKEMRRRAKIINFGILFGMGVNALKAQLGTSTAEAHQFLEDYLTTFTRLAEYLEETRGYARKHGYTETLFGRRREFSGIKSPLPYVRAQAERMAINAPIQGTEADVIKLAMVQVYEYLKQEGESDSAHLTLQVHDELVYEIADSKVEELTEKIRTIMENALPADQTHGVPIIVEAKRGKNWGEMTAI